VDGATAIERPDSVIPFAVARWRAAESRLFAGLLLDAEPYERSLVVMAAAIEILQTGCATKELTLEVDPLAVATEAAAATGVDLVGVDLELIGAAALTSHWWRLGLAADQNMT
jgi:hypothetical protein